MKDVSMKIIDRIAKQEEIQPVEMSPLLHNVVDPEALDALLRGDSVQVTFPYAGYTITVHSDGTVRVKPQTAGA